jgi:two-component system cell cycle sensor histidine kinase/response regulator CckA
VVSFPYWADERTPLPPPTLARGLTHYVVRTGLPLHATPAAAADLLARGEIAEASTHVDWIGVPLRAQDKTFGALVVQSYRERIRFGGRELEVLQFVSHQVAMAIERRRAEDRLRESEATYRSLVENAPYGIYRSSPEGRFLAVNAALVRILGYDSKEEILALSLPTDVYSDPAERSRVLREVSAGEGLPVEATWKTKDGRTITVRMTGRGIRDTAGTVQYYETVLEDISERRMLEAQLRQSQKMEAIGQLAGGVAHDFNNILNVILGYTELLERQTTLPDSQREKIEEIHKAGSRAAALTRQLLAFSRKHVLQPRVLDLNLVIDDLGKMLRRLIGEDIQFVTSFRTGLGCVKADPGQIQQVIVNLAVNARDAMPKGGRLVIETTNVILDEEYARLHAGARAGPHVSLSVSDTGHGMDAQTLAHLFEPFFTTKAPGSGTGLGLATVYGIVKQSGGHIAVRSEPGHGSTFTIYLPRAGEGEPVNVPRERVSHSLLRGSGTVLVLEDDSALRELIREILEDAGYTVLKPEGPEKAVELAGAYPGTIEIVLSDVIMPRVSGPEVVRRLRAIRPHVKIVYMSGYTNDAIVLGVGRDDGPCFIEKPFSADALLMCLRSALAGSAGDRKRVSPSSPVKRN